MEHKTMEQRSDLFYKLWEKDPATAEYVGKLEQVIIDCSSFVPWESFVGQEIRRLLPHANWDPTTLLPDSADEGRK